MPTVVKDAIKFLVLVAEESYDYDVGNDEQYSEHGKQILIDAMNEDKDDIWFESWIVEKGRDARSHPAAHAHELLGRVWRDI